MTQLSRGLKFNFSQKLHICLTDFNAAKNQNTPSRAFEHFEYDMNLGALIDRSQRQPKYEFDQDMQEGELTSTRRRFDLGDFSFESDGSINVIVTNSDLASPVYLFKVLINFS
jgi:hypothetical protein